MIAGDLPNIEDDGLEVPGLDKLQVAAPSSHPPRILLLFGSLRERSYSRLPTFEAERLLRHFGAETRVHDLTDLPLPDGATVDHPTVRELRDAMTWSEGQVWTSPERHGAMSAVLEAQIDWVPLALGALRPTQGRAPASMQVCGGSQSFDAVDQMRILGRWMWMVTTPNRSSVAKGFEDFDEAGRMRPSSDYDRVVDVMEERVEFTRWTCDRSDDLTSRYSERKEAAETLEARLKLSSVR
ncbi:arsenical resistance protein ArsH [Siculibacillus lacustris]|uniref:Arsenical resistance protein ArsH n=1 Tax=Siculibacillus lacustris TaxID=1549641 RepID=A0A4Q9VGV1_9HYPH|nr:arsenical resistance protein ArsH [Siculibacillus lacustris]TBW33416.1 arsenical resistance protein ArsH [Siculibacillus lacustris]